MRYDWAAEKRREEGRGIKTQKGEKGNRSMAIIKVFVYLERR